MADINGMDSTRLSILQNLSEIGRIGGFLPVTGSLSSFDPFGESASSISLIAVNELLRSRLEAVTSALVAGQEALGAAGALETGLTQTARLLEDARAVLERAADIEDPDELRSLQAELDDLLRGVDTVAEDTSFRGEQLLAGRRAALRFDFDTRPAGSELELTLLDARALALGTGQGGAAIAELATGGELVLSVDPTGAAAALERATGEVRAARDELLDFGAEILAGQLELNEAALFELSGTNAIFDQDFAMGLVSQFSGQESLAQSVLALTRNSISRDALVAVLGA